MKYLSVCSGIEAASVAWHGLGWQPLAFSEIEAFPRAVLAHHYPDVPLHGDFTKLRDEPFIEDADILVGGTPCQAFSVAGLRNSLADDRGNLTLEFVRLADAIDAARSAAGRDPGIVVWENVPGVLSVKDNAFGCFLAALAGDAAPYDPPRGKWTNAGVVDGPLRTIAWRILDAQYFGLAQRRRRVFVVASARAGFDPAAVLLEFEGVRRDTPPRREAGKIAPTIPSRSTAGGGLGTDFDLDGGVIASTGDISHCLNAGGMGRQDYETETLVTHSLRAEGFDASEDGTGRGTPLVPVTVGSLTSGHGGSAGHQYRQKGNEDCLVPVAVPDVVNALNAQSGETGKGDAAPCVAFSVCPDHCGGDKSGQEVAFVKEIDVSRTLDCTGADVSRKQGGVGVAQHMAVRRLTPVECERLQGFPDDYTAIPWKRKPAADCPDGPRYKALGNSMAVPVMRWIGERVAAELSSASLPRKDHAA